MLFPLVWIFNFVKLFISTLLFLFFASSIAVCAQTISVETQATFRVSNQELFEKAENSYNRRRYGSELLSRAGLELKEVVASCAGYSWRYQAEEYLKIIREESAELNFIIALYYWDKFQNGKTKSLAGVRSRLKKIIEEYRTYSQIVLVKQLSDQVNKETF